MNLAEFQNETFSWHSETFKGASLKQVKRKLLEESAELMTAADEDAPDEMADVLIVLVVAAARLKVDLLDVARRKMERNRRRVWDSGDHHREGAKNG